mgnify:CR=1 FL=1
MATSQNPRRDYHSPQRRAQAERTQQRVVAAAGAAVGRRDQRPLSDTARSSTRVTLGPKRTWGARSRALRPSACRANGGPDRVSTNSRPHEGRNVHVSRLLGCAALGAVGVLLHAVPAEACGCFAPPSVAELERHDGIFYTNRGAADWRFRGTSGAVVVRGRSTLRVNNGDVMRDAAIAGLGLALLPTFAIADARRSGELRVVELEVEPESEFVYIAHPDGRRASAKLRAVADHLRGVFGDPPYWDSPEPTLSRA